MTCRTELIMRDPPGPPITSSTFPSRATMVGLMLLSGVFRGAIAFASVLPIRPKALGWSGWALKVVHLVVEHNTGSGNHDPTAEIQVHRLGCGHGVAIFVSDGQMSRARRL